MAILFGTNADPTGVSDSSESLSEISDVSKDISIPEGKWKIDTSVEYENHYQISSSALFEDDTVTGEYFKHNLGNTHIQLNKAYRDVDDRRHGAIDLKVVCYGDSNTRFYAGADGPSAYSYCELMRFYAIEHPSLWDADFILKGNSGQTSAYGVTNFATQVGANNPHFVVLGFGTNDVKLTSPSVDDYIANIRTMVDASLDAGITPIVLEIPWFSSAYGADGVTSQERIKLWNSYLRRMCADYDIPFIDLYNSYKDEAALYYNETGTIRHLDVYAQEITAQKIILEIIQRHGVGTILWRPAILKRSFHLPSDREISEATDGVTVSAYNPEHSIQTINIASGESIKIRCGGRACIDFYPRADASVTMAGDNPVAGSSGTFSENVTITNDTDGTNPNLYFPIHRYVTPSISTGSTRTRRAGYDLTISCTSGTAYIRAYAMVEGAPIDDSVLAPFNRIAYANLPTNPVIGRIYILNELESGMVHNGSVWVSLAVGMPIIGTTTERNVLSTSTANATIPNGYKFYNTTTAQGERYYRDSNTWVAV